MQDTGVHPTSLIRVVTERKWHCLIPYPILFARPYCLPKVELAFMQQLGSWNIQNLTVLLHAGRALLSCFIDPGERDCFRPSTARCFCSSSLAWLWQGCCNISISEPYFQIVYSWACENSCSEIIAAISSLPSLCKVEEKNDSEDTFYKKVNKFKILLFSLYHLFFRKLAVDLLLQKGVILKLRKCFLLLTNQNMFTDPSCKFVPTENLIFHLCILGILEWTQSLQQALNTLSGIRKFDARH